MPCATHRFCPSCRTLLPEEQKELTAQFVESISVGEGGSYAQQAWQWQHGELDGSVARTGVVPSSGSRILDGEATCHLCNKTFHGRYQKYNLKRHLTIHAGEKPFLCPFCPHRTNQKYNMQQHLLVCRSRPKQEVPPQLHGQHVPAGSHGQHQH